MKRIIIAILSLIVAAVLSGFHSYNIIKLNNAFQASAKTIESAFNKNEWDTINAEIKIIEQNWEDKKLWVCLTIPTKQIDEIDVSIGQSIEYAKLSASPDFIGEFRLLCMKMEHLPKQEVISLEELL